MKLDKDIKAMTPGRARRELQRVREAIFTHGRKTGNARCHHNDKQLYRKTLPGTKKYKSVHTKPGRMDLSEEVHLRECRYYIRRQQCQSGYCNRRSRRRTLIQVKPSRKKQP